MDLTKLRFKVDCSSAELRLIEFKSVEEAVGGIRTKYPHGYDEEIKIYVVGWSL